MPLWKPSAEEIRKIRATIEAETDDAQLQDNLFFTALYGFEAGLYSKREPATWTQRDDGSWVRHKRRLSRREWIERFLMIRNKAGAIVPLKLNRAQRRLEAWILRMERAGVPVRIICLKARQMGFSTYVQAVMFHEALRGKHVRGLIVADTRDRSEVLLQIAEVARTNMPKSKESVWDFKMRSKAVYSLVWGTPIHSEVKLTSAEVDNPGRGGVRNIVHLSETAFWENAEAKQMGVLASLPTLPGTYGFDESTANGASGKFYDDFTEAWSKRHIPLREAINPWHAEFFAWWEHDEYFYSRTYGAGRPVPKDMERHILSTLDEEEKWLIEQVYFVRWTAEDEWDETLDWETGEKKWTRRGVGWKKVGIDQLAWRRAKIADKEIGGDINRFNQEYPSRWEVAFLASGRPVFDPTVIAEYAKKVQPAVFVGSIRDQTPTSPPTHNGQHTDDEEALGD